MEGPAHGAIVAGLSSSLAAGWIRQRVRDEYDPNTVPPTLQSRLQNRAPLAIAGLGFSGLSALVARKFDIIEAEIFKDPSSHLAPMQQGNHHRIHSLPILGPAIAAAHAIRHASSKIADAIASGLNISGGIPAIVEALNSLAEWVISSIGAGALGHLVGDLPTSGEYGFAALKLLDPISDRNFALGWVTASSDSWNYYLKTAGYALAGAAWSVAGLYLVSWKPPEDSVLDYFQKLSESEDYIEVKNQILTDISCIFDTLISNGKDQFWSLPLFRSHPTAIQECPEEHWYQMNFDLEQIFQVESADISTLVNEGVLPSEFARLLGETPISTSDRGIDSNPVGISSAIDPDSTTSLTSADESVEESSVLEEEPEKETNLQSETSLDESSITEDNQDEDARPMTEE